MDQADNRLPAHSLTKIRDRLAALCGRFPREPGSAAFAAAVANAPKPLPFPPMTEACAAELLSLIHTASAFWAASACELHDQACRAITGKQFDEGERLGRKFSRTNDLVGTCRLAARPEYLIGLWRWAWAKKYDLLHSDPVLFRSSLIEWHDSGHKDGLDCCPQCGSSAWAETRMPEAVTVPAIGAVETGKAVAFYACTDCGNRGRVLDVLG